MESYPMDQSKLYKFGMNDPTVYRYVDFDLVKSREDNDMLNVVMIFEAIDTGSVLRVPISDLTSYVEVHEGKIAA